MLHGRTELVSSTLGQIALEPPKMAEHEEGGNDDDDDDDRRVYGSDDRLQ